MRVDAFLAARLEVSRSRAQQILESATVDGVAVKPKYTLKEGSEVRYSMPDPVTPTSTGHLNIPAEQLLPAEAFLYEDEHLLVLNKPRGLTVHAGAGETGATLVDLLRAQGMPLSSVGPAERSGIVHRLDKDTTGLIIVCKTDAAHWKLAADFEGRRIVKFYETVVCAVPPARGRVEAPIGRHHTSRIRMAVVPEGRMSVTEYETLKSWESYAHLKIDLLTGRTHQIRVHLAYIHHPVVGDITYGGHFRALNSAPTEAVRLAIEGLGGQALHAAHLRFDHPVDGREIVLDAPKPANFEALMQALDEHAANTPKAPGLYTKWVYQEVDPNS